MAGGGGSGVGTGQMRKNNYALIAMISPGNETKRNETRRAPTKIELKNANELQWRTPQVRGGDCGGEGRGRKRVLRVSERRKGVSRNGTRYGRCCCSCCADRRYNAGANYMAQWGRLANKQTTILRVELEK